MEMSHIGSKLKVLKLKFSDDMLVHLLLLQLPVGINDIHCRLLLEESKGQGVLLE